MKALRTTLLTIMAVAGFILLISEPADNTDWLTAFLTSKGIGFALLFAVLQLASTWHKNGKIYDVSEYTNE